MRTNLLGAFFFFFSLNFAQAQMMEPVKWSFAAEKINAGEYDIVFTANIEKGWYVYSPYLKPGGPIPTEFEFADPANMSLLGKVTEEGNKKVVFDEMFGIELVKFSDRAKFKQRIKVESGIQYVRGQVTFMTCDDESCLPPVSLDFEILLD